MFNAKSLLLSEIESPALEFQVVGFDIEGRDRLFDTSGGSATFINLMYLLLLKIGVDWRVVRFLIRFLISLLGLLLFLLVKPLLLPLILLFIIFLLSHFYNSSHLIES